jgi:DNA-binding MarR family transcriptional regulator
LSSRPTHARTTAPETSGAAAGDSRPRLDPEVADLMRLSADLQRATSRQLRDLWRTRKLSERGIFILELVNAGLDRPSRLIEYFDVLPSTITFETDKLAAAGLLVREADPTDRRVVRLSLTDAGRAVHAETTQAINALLEPVLANLAAEDRERFFSLYHRLVDPLLPPRA